MSESAVAVYWNNYEQHKTEIESSIRQKIYIAIQDAIEESKSKALPEQFIAGLQCAQALTLDMTSHKVDKTLQHELF
jgi:hypothetical protein